MNVYLIGYRGTGKSTVAQRLALLTGRDWADADVEIELRAAKSIKAIFEDGGEEVFRDLETEVLAELCRRENLVVGVGGGGVLRRENRQAMKSSGKLVWLIASPQVIAARLAADPTTAARRPHLTTAGGLDEIERLLAARTPIYEGCADLVVDTESKSPTEIAEEIAAGLRP